MQTGLSGKDQTMAVEAIDLRVFSVDRAIDCPGFESEGVRDAFCQCFYGNLCT